MPSEAAASFRVSISRGTGAIGRFVAFGTSELPPDPACPLQHALGSPIGDSPPHLLPPRRVFPRVHERPRSMPHLGIYALCFAGRLDRSRRALPRVRDLLSAPGQPREPPVLECLALPHRGVGPTLRTQVALR